MAYDIMEVELAIGDLSERGGKTVQSYKAELLAMRAGRANPHILDKVTVDYYGTQTPINQMANITVPEARMLMISVWDVSAIKLVEKAIVAANLGIFPTNDGKCLRMVFPELTEERRRSLAKEVKSMSEKAKVAVRNIRRDTINDLRALKKDSVITEDGLALYEKDVEKIVNGLIADIDKLTSDKEAEIMSV